MVPTWRGESGTFEAKKGPFFQNFKSRPLCKAKSSKLTLQNGTPAYTAYRDMIGRTPPPRINFSTPLVINSECSLRADILPRVYSQWEFKVAHF